MRFTLDDFGTGQSNLSYIVDMPIDIVNFDRGMTNAYFDNRKRHLGYGCRNGHDSKAKA